MYLAEQNYDVRSSSLLSLGSMLFPVNNIVNLGPDELNGPTIRPYRQLSFLYLNMGACVVTIAPIYMYLPADQKNLACPMCNRVLLLG